MVCQQDSHIIEGSEYMISFISALAVLVLGYALYGRLAEKVFAPDDRQTPANTDNDGVDFMPVKTHKAVLIQLLAGTVPIFGALMGACFGPVVFLLFCLYIYFEIRNTRSKGEQ